MSNNDFASRKKEFNNELSKGVNRGNTTPIVSFNKIEEGWIEEVDGRRYYYKRGKENNLPEIALYKINDALVSKVLERLNKQGIKTQLASQYYGILYYDEHKPVWISDYRASAYRPEIEHSLHYVYEEYMYWDEKCEKWVEKEAPLYKILNVYNGTLKYMGTTYIGLAPSEEMVKKA